MNDKNKVTIVILCAVVIIASFMPWGSVVASLGFGEFPFDEFFGRHEITLNGWNSSFNLWGLSIPNWLLSVIAAAIVLFLFIDFNSKLRKGLAIYGIIHSLLFSIIIIFEGTIGIGLILTFLAFTGIMFYLRKVEVSNSNLDI
ncbi:hypothetical protein [Anaerobranca gottschalkii]|uniref:DUF4064 domain-containing protein n=1 Tax=Anaerobranca gottschalkii DSM 13577 TaxID=1120990 RepID=A0A1I0B160_9FIRM|nr:hypothetical protein [Anaerobranca gottschalkii]SET00452.1 hypothetical protein SAMN03080614_10308 [Anaerobranca gottschalkii DSM 13577]